jgi:hypothetical protein
MVAFELASGIATGCYFMKLKLEANSKKSVSAAREAEQEKVAKSDSSFAAQNNSERTTVTLLEARGVERKGALDENRGNTKSRVSLHFVKGERVEAWDPFTSTWDADAVVADVQGVPPKAVFGDLPVGTVMVSYAAGTKVQAIVPALLRTWLRKSPGSEACPSGGKAGHQPSQERTRLAHHRAPGTSAGSSATGVQPPHLHCHQVRHAVRQGNPHHHLSHRHQHVVVPPQVSA